MPRQAEGPQPLTTAQRVQRHRKRQAARLAELESALRYLLNSCEAGEGKAFPYAAPGEGAVDAARQALGIPPGQHP